LTSIKDFLGGLGMIGCSLILIVGVIFASGALYIVYLNTLGVATQNAQRVVTQQSLPYIQAHQQILMQYWSDYQTGDATHKAVNTTLICQQAPLLDQTQWPAQITAFVSANCR
jgi:hypothetical protein